MSEEKELLEIEGMLKGVSIVKKGITNEKEWTIYAYEVEVGKQYPAKLTGFDNMTANVGKQVKISYVEVQKEGYKFPFKNARDIEVLDKNEDPKNLLTTAKGECVDTIPVGWDSLGQKEKDLVDALVGKMRDEVEGGGSISDKDIMFTLEDQGFQKDWCEKLLKIIKVRFEEHKDL